MIASLALLAAAAQLTRLGNGIPIVVEPRTNGGLVCVQALVDASDLTPEQLGGLEYVVACLLRESERLSVSELRALADRSGGAIESELTRDCVRIEITVPATHLSHAALLLGETLRRTKFTEEGIAWAERKMARERADLRSLAHLAGIREVLAGAGCGPVDVERPKAGDAAALYAKVFRPERTAVGVVGDVSADDATRSLAGSLSTWEGGGARESRFRKAKGQGGHPDGYVTAAWVRKGPSVKGAEFPGWLLEVTALGRGKSSPLAKMVRRDGAWSYASGLSLTLRRSESVAVFFATFRGGDESAAERSEQMRVGLERELAALDKGRRLAAAKALAGFLAVGVAQADGRVGAFNQGMRGPRERAFWLAWGELRGLGFRFADEFPEVARLAAEKGDRM